MKKVSIIIPVYQVEKYIERCVQSAIHQTYQNIEIICVDDQGTDHSMQIVERLQGQYPDLIHIVHGENNVGLGGARDRGLRAAQGEYITFLDSDDYLEKDFVERYMEAVGVCDIVIGNFIRMTEKSCHPYSVDVGDENFPWAHVSACTKLYRKAFLEKYRIDFAGIRRYEDELFTYKLLLKKPVIQLIDYAGYYYCINGESITQNKKQSRSCLFEEYCKNIQVFLDGLECQDRGNSILGYCLLSGLVANLLFNGRGCGIRKMRKLYAMFRKTTDRIYAEFYPGVRVKTCVLKGESWKKKYAMWLMTHLRRIKCDRLLFLFMSFL